MPNESYKKWHKPKREVFNENGSLKKGQTHQGYAIIKNTNKYVGDPSLIIYRSAWEQWFIQWCDASQSVIKWSSEPIKVPYYDRVSKLEECHKYGLDPNNPANWLVRNYNIDFYIEYQRDVLEKWFVEIKPYDKLKRPIPPQSGLLKEMRRYNIEAREYLCNEAKFAAADAFAKQRNAFFYTLTEYELYSMLGSFWKGPIPKPKK